MRNEDTQPPPSEKISAEGVAIAGALSQVTKEAMPKLSKVLHRCSTVRRMEFDSHQQNSYDNVNAFLTELRKPLRDIISPKLLMYSLTILFTMLDGGKEQLFV